MRTWIKLYTEILDDPKIGRLTWAQRGMWDALLLLAGRLDHRDENDNPTGQLDTLENVAWHLRCTKEELEETVKAMNDLGMIDERDGILFVTNFTKRQAISQSAKHEQVRQRIAKYRTECNENKGEGNADVTTLQRNVTTLQTSCNAPRKEIDKEREKEKECEITLVIPPKAGASPSPPKPIPKKSPDDPFKKARRARATDSPAVEYLTGVAKVRLKQVVKAQIDAAIPKDDPEALERWKGVVNRWLAAGYNPRNVAGMLEWYQNPKKSQMTPAERARQAIEAATMEDQIARYRARKEADEARYKHETTN